MIEIKAITIQGVTMPMGKAPIILLNLSDLDEYRNELWQDICQQKKIAFDKEEAFAMISFTYGETHAQ